MDVIEKSLTDIQPYEKNLRRNDEAVKYVAESIKQFGFKVPIVVDSADVIVAGHTRYKAAKKLGLKKLPCVVADDLTDKQNWSRQKKKSIRSRVLAMKTFTEREVYLKKVIAAER